uniref:Platelet-derived growth factor C n=1 Tax=Denticeps clupeoides TaxID=299321 RepID=A0AAY4D131_9TELE
GPVFFFFYLLTCAIHLHKYSFQTQEKVVSVGAEGVLHSPNFPHIYPRNTKLVWRLVAANENSRIKLTFDERFGLEDPEDGLCKYDYVEIEDPVEGKILGRWCGSQSFPGPQVSKGSQVLIRFTSDEYFPSAPGFSIRYSLLPQVTSSRSHPLLHAASTEQSRHGGSVHSPTIPELWTHGGRVVSGFSTVEEVMKYLEPDHWQLDIEDLYKPTWHMLGKAFLYPKKPRGVVDLNQLREEVRLYSCTPRNFSVSLREELRRTDVVFWPSCLLVQRCGGNCPCCSNRCYECQCQPVRVTKKYHEVLMLKYKAGGKGLQKLLTDVPLEHHEECSCVCKDNSD